MHAACMEQPGTEITQCCEQQRQQVCKTITHGLLISFFRIHFTCLQLRGQTKRAVSDSAGLCGFIEKK